MHEKKKKIFLVGDCQNVHLQRWIRPLSKKFDVVVFSSSSCVHEECIHSNDIIPGSLNFLGPIRLLTEWFFFRRYVKSSGIDLIHIHYFGGLGVRVGLYAAFFNIHPFVISLWGSDVTLSQKPHVKIFKKYIFERVDAVTAVCNFLSDKAKEITLKIKRLEVIPFGVDLKRFNPERFRSKELVQDKKIMRIGFFKHFEEIYGPKYLVKAFAIIAKKFKNSELFLAGRGSLKYDLERLAGNLGIINKVHFLGFIKDVPEVMSTMDITVIPSLSEGLPVAALESQALGIPVVASRVGGLPEAVKDGETGFLVSPKNEGALVEAINKLISDRNLRIKMGKEGQKFVKERYNWEENVKEVESLYASLFDAFAITQDLIKRY